MHGQTFAALAQESAGQIVMAVDTEFEQNETVTVQFAIRQGNAVLVQLYHAPNVRPPEPAWFGAFGKRFAGKAGRVIVRQAKPLTPDLSPARVLADLLRLAPADFLSRSEGDARRPPIWAPGGKRSARREGSRLSRIEIVLVGHFLRADLLRAFGRAFYDDLLAPADRHPGPAPPRDGRVIGLRGTAGIADAFQDPVVEYVADGDNLYEVRLGTMDTNCVCGPAKLDELARSYIGVAKDESVTDAEKTMMKAVFQDPERAPDAYRYAAQDAVIVLLIAERMKKQHADLYAGFDVPPEDVPPMHGTPGLRVANLFLQHARRTSAAGSARLGSSGPGGAAGLNRLKELARRGSANALSDGRVTRYGRQTGDTHGGLLQSRTPYEFFHWADEQFRDVDLKSCYPTIIRSMTVYLGRPLVLEPGHGTWTLRRAVEYLREHADGDWAWFVKASGPVGGFVNTLIPSTVDALTNENYHGRGRDRAARSANVALLSSKDRAWARERVDDRKYTALLTDEVNAGVVTWATWLTIQALPPQARRQYEDLRAETIVFYPKKLAAGSGAEFDELVTKYRTCRPVDWRQELDLGRMTRTTVEDIDDKYVSLRYPVEELADRLVEMREEAGKDTAEGLLYKTLANTMYGVFACPFLPTSNPVAGNAITGVARALAYAMTQALNGLMVITDGALYRRDRVPADTFASRLRRSPDYPLVHADAGPFVDPAAVPGDDTGFTGCYVDHVVRFFGVAGRPEYEGLFQLHALAHKSLPDGGPAFDGVWVDGGANYAKLVPTGADKMRVADVKARSFGSREKKSLKGWLLRVYASDQYTDPPPRVPSGRLLAVGDALAQAGRAVASHPEGSTVVPLGLKQPSFSTYKLIKPSGFVFRTARQRDRILKDWRRLNQKTECGPELLAQRRTYRGKLSAVARRLFELIRAGRDRLNVLNVDKLWRPGSVGLRHGEAVREARGQARGQFTRGLLVAAAESSPVTGLVVDRRSLATVRAAADSVR